MEWAGAHGLRRGALLERARIVLPVDPLTLFMLARSRWTQPAARQLVAAGERIDQKDNYNLDALALALVADKLAAVRRLVALGASPTVPVGAAQIPVALLPVLRGDIAGVQLMRRLGVNYAKISFRGHTAADIAERMNDTALLRALGSEAPRCEGGPRLSAAGDSAWAVARRAAAAKVAAPSRGGRWWCLTRG